MATLQGLTELGNLCQCTLKCTRQSRWKETTQRYLADMLIRSVELQEEVLEGRYRVSKTTDFPLNERGHLRWIEAPVVRDRAVQKSLMEQVLVPSIRPYLIYDNYASLAERGTSFARKRFEVMLRRYIQRNGTDGYILLGDIRKYFESVVHATLKKMLGPKLTAEPQEVADLINYVIDSSSHSDNGLNLGSECPQIFAVYYLNPLDVYIKVVKAIRYYGRYMDDFFIIGRTKAELTALLLEIEAKVAELGLTVNAKKTQIVKLRHGFTWLQVKYFITPTGKIEKAMSHDKVVRERRRLKAFKRMLDQGTMSENDIYNCYKSWRGSVVKDHNVYRSTITSLDKLYKSLFPAHEDVCSPMRSDIARRINHEAETRDLYYCLTVN